MPTASPSRRASGNGHSTSSASASAASPGEFDDGLRPDDTWLPFLAIDPVDGSTPDPGALSATLAGADLVVIENLCSLPINPDASTLTADVLAEHHGPVVFHHHDLPWQRAGLAAPPGIPPHRPNSLHVTVNDQSRIQLEHRGFEAVTVRNTFDLDPPRGDRDATRDSFGFAPDDLVLLQPSRAIPRKNVPAAVEFATELAALEVAQRASLDHRARGGRLRHRVRSHPRRRNHPDHRRSRARRLPTHTPRPISSSTHRRGKDSATP